MLRDVSERKRLEDEARTKSNQLAILTGRNRLARDLHDAVTQSLFSASIMADVLPKLWLENQEKGEQKALHNIAKHSQAFAASVQLSLLPRNSMMLIHDDGWGFVFAGIDGTHLGLRIMRERSDEVGAKLNIESEASTGTDVLVTGSNER